MKEEFITKAHVAIKEYGLEAEPTSQAFKETKTHGIRLCTIPKKNLGIDKDYQRAINHKQIKRINENWDIDNYEPANVYHYKGTDGLNRYQVTDGQHRVCAHPDDTVTCRVVNTLSAVTRSLQVNDPSTKSAWTVDDLFWAKKTAINRGSQKDTTFIGATIKLFKQFGWTPLHPDKKLPQDLGGRIARIHKSWEVNTIRNLDARIALPQKERDQMAFKVMQDAAKIMSSVFPDIDYGSYGGHLWTALFDWLSSEKHGLACNYSVDEVIKVLKRGNWSINGKGRLRKEILKTRKDFYDAAQDYIRKAAVTNRLHNAYRQLFTDMITVSKR
jgi:hypothetical protein|tara:strand:+ start:66 stop:1052 length:987 start_codon:yes stop_codon:yes gene_type:complete